MITILDQLKIFLHSLWIALTSFNVYGFLRIDIAILLVCFVIAVIGIRVFRYEYKKDLVGIRAKTENIFKCTLYQGLKAFALCIAITILVYPIAIFIY